MQFTVYDVFQSHFSHQHVSVTIAAIFREMMTTIVTENVGEKCVNKTRHKQ